MSAFGSLQKYRYVRRAFGRWQQYLDFHRALCTLQQYRDVHRAFGSLQRKPLAASTTHKAFDSFQQNHDCPSVLWQLTRTLLWPVTSFNRIMILHRSFGSLQRHYFSLWQLSTESRLPVDLLAAYKGIIIACDSFQQNRDCP